MLQLQLHDSEVAERIPNNGMNSEAVRFEAGSRWSRNIGVHFCLRRPGVARPYFNHEINWFW